MTKQVDCLDNPGPGADATDRCEGPVEYRFALSGTGRSFPRCDRHWGDRLAVQEGINARYGHPDSVMPPPGFDPSYAGESWDGE